MYTYQAATFGHRGFSSTKSMRVICVNSVHAVSVCASLHSSLRQELSFVIVGGYGTAIYEEYFQLSLWHCLAYALCLYNYGFFINMPAGWFMNGRKLMRIYGATDYWECGTIKKMEILDQNYYNCPNNEPIYWSNAFVTYVMPELFLLKQTY
jgi:hypothetical protein